MAKIKPMILAAELPQKAQTRLVRWMVHAARNDPKAGEAGMAHGIDGRIVTFHGRAGEAALKAIVEGKDVTLYRWKRGLDLELRTALAQQQLSQKCGVLTSDPSVIAALDAANLPVPEEEAPQSIYDVAIGALTPAEEGRMRSRQQPQASSTD